MSRDNWERLVAAVLKKEHFRQLCYQHSRSSSDISTTISSDNFSGQILNSLEPINTVNPSTSSSVSRVTKNATRFLIHKLFAAWYRRRKAKEGYFHETPGEEELGIILGQVSRFTLHELQVATDNFSRKNILPYGYSKVYEGRLADGFPVAIKRHNDRGGNPTAEVRFQTEVEINSIAHHANVLHLLGICSTSNERLIVYPLLANGSVWSCLTDRHKSQSPLDWSVRKGIALGVAKGLAYLHEKCDPQIIHRDIKTSNIFLDENFEAFVGNFESALIMDYDVANVTISVVGTTGHIAPEYLASATCSDKTDVFAYGVFLLEFITGRRAFDLQRFAHEEDGITLLDWTQRNLEGRKWDIMADSYCGGNGMEEVIELLTKIAILCMRHTPERRPKMSRIVRMLEVGDFLAESWNWFSAEDESCSSATDIMYGDDNYTVQPEELSGPR